MLRFHLAYGGAFHLYTLTRDKLLFDSRYALPNAAPAEARTLHYALLEGSCVWRREGGADERFDGPCLLRLTPSLLEGASGRRARSFYNHGSPLRLVVFWAPNDFVMPGARLEPGDDAVHVVPWSPESRTAFEAFHVGTEHAEPTPLLRTHARALLAQLSADGILAREAVPAFDKRWGLLVERTFEGLLRAWCNSRNLPSLSDVSGVVGLSRSQLARDIQTFANSIALPRARWRSTTFDLRLRQATTFLSAPDATIGDVAKVVGYGSVQAMDRAFRDAGLPPPVDVRNEARARVRELEACAPAPAPDSA